LPAILQSLPLGKGLRILDLGCGNGFVAGHLANLGHHVVGVDASGDGIEIARAKYLNAKFHVASLYDDALKAAVGYEYQVVISSEVIEHLYWPKVLLRRAHDALAVGGRLIVTTPYHGYLKNLALSLVGGWDKHFDVAWDGGHIKFFSNATLSSLMAEAGFVRLGFRGAGRFPGLWKSMIMQGEKG
jgi:2-polyprenyl-3-methyl-5-hydroxy-6-metoxy-1,4-benzoquinol methylase